MASGVSAQPLTEWRAPRPAHPSWPEHLAGPDRLRSVLRGRPAGILLRSVSSTRCAALQRPKHREHGGTSLPYLQNAPLFSRFSIDASRSGGTVNPSNARLQPRRRVLRLAAGGCKPMLAGHARSTFIDQRQESASVRRRHVSRPHGTARGLRSRRTWRDCLSRTTENWGRQRAATRNVW